MSDFEAILSRVTDKTNPTIHGAIFKAVNKHGVEIHSKVAGLSSLPTPSNSSPAPLHESAVIKAASSTKLIASIALLQCIEAGLIGLDDPVSSVLPELAHPVIVTGTHPDTGELQYTQAKRAITPRHLLTHTSGLGYWFLNPLLTKWATQTPEGKKSRESKLVHERHVIPLLFEPGEGWAYGVGLDWAGCLVRRLHGGMSLEEYMIEHIWKRVGLEAPFPTFYLSRDGEEAEEYRGRLMGGAERTRDAEGGKIGLKEHSFWHGDNSQDQDGGHGLCFTAKDYVAVLADLLADEPKLLGKAMMKELFTPQLAPGSAAQKTLGEFSAACDSVSGRDVPGEVVNHGLGGLLVTEGTRESGMPAGTLAWGGATNTIWFACRDQGMAGLMATQLNPFGDEVVIELAEAWRKEVWSKENL